MLYVIMARLFNKRKIISGGLSFKSWTKSTYYTTITFIFNISKKAILSCYEIIVSVQFKEKFIRDYIKVHCRLNSNTMMGLVLSINKIFILLRSVYHLGVIRFHHSLGLCSILPDQLFWHASQCFRNKTLD